MKKAVWFLLAVTLALAPFAAWSLYKPIRVLAPEWAAPVACKTRAICLEDETKMPQAAALYDEALRFVAETVGPFHKPPRVTFCSTEACFGGFGYASTAGTTGSWGIVIGPRGWKDYYVRHEMIHHRQAEELGLLASFRNPPWFTEGMAYSLSGDSRRPLSGKFEAYRAEFEAWYRKTGAGGIWRAARKL